jgi:hypothetical protein
MEYLIVILSVGLPLSIVAFVFILVGHKKYGVWFWTQLFILFKGQKSTAVIIDLTEKATSISINKVSQYMFTVVMDVVDPNLGGNYRVKRKYMDSFYSVLRNKNTEIPVIIHPNNKEIVMIDFKAISKNKKEMMERNNESDEDRLNKLMNR